jgi:hypothetical protein
MGGPQAVCLAKLKVDRMLAIDRDYAAGSGLILGGLLVLGLWAFLGWIVPLLLLGIAVILAWKWSGWGAAVSMAAAVSLFWLGMAIGWLAWVVGFTLIGTGMLFILWPRRKIVPQDAGRE